MLYLLRTGKQGMLPGDNPFDALGRIFPLIFRLREIRAHVEHHSLPGDSLGSPGFENRKS
jgi:hypothetical protein